MIKLTQLHQHQECEDGTPVQIQDQLELSARKIKKGK